MLEDFFEFRVEQGDEPGLRRPPMQKRFLFQQGLSPKIHGDKFSNAEQKQGIGGQTIAVFLHEVGKQNDAESFEAPGGGDPLAVIFRANMVAIKITGTKNWSCSGLATSAVVIFFQRLALAGGEYRPRISNAK